MTTQHTPGPWAYTDRPPGGPSDRWRISTSEPGVPHGWVANAVCSEPDARLIAAAPDLLAVLKKWAQFTRDNYSDEDITWAEEMRAAIAKAEGRA